MLIPIIIMLVGTFLGGLFSWKSHDNLSDLGKEKYDKSLFKTRYANKYFTEKGKKYRNKAYLTFLIMIISLIAYFIIDRLLRS